MKVMSIYHDSICDGEGIRTVIFFAGCPHRCKGCHNPESWNMQNGEEMTMDAILCEVLNNPLANVTFSGGDPFLQAKELIPLAKAIKDAGKNIWAYSGWTYEELQKDPNRKELLKYIDVLVDGKFILEQRNTKLQFRGSPNQRVLQLQNGEIVKQLYKK